jgi:abhydrolase domain-containing protein 6
MSPSTSKYIPALSWVPTADTYFRRAPVVFINGLAEQNESWYPNRAEIQNHFEVHTPGVLVYDGPMLQERLAQKEAITVSYLTERLAEYLDKFVQKPPYHLVGSSLGGQVVVQYASLYPDKIDRLVLLCPSGMGSDERLPVTEGARHGNYRGLVESTFCNTQLASSGIVDYYEEKFKSRAWRKAFFETVRSTKSHSIRDRLAMIARPVLVICGAEDRIVDTRIAQEAVAPLPNYQCVTITNCGHAPQLEQPQIVNQLIVQFLRGEQISDLHGLEETAGACT